MVWWSPYIGLEKPFYLSRFLVQGIKNTVLNMKHYDQEIMDAILRNHPMETFVRGVESLASNEQNSYIISVAFDMCGKKQRYDLCCLILGKPIKCGTLQSLRDWGFIDSNMVLKEAIKNNLEGYAKLLLKEY